MNCRHCSATVTNGLELCERCQTTLRAALVNVAAYYADVLRITPGQRVRVRSAYQSTPPPATKATFDPVSSVLGIVDNTVSTWTRMLLEDRPNIGAPPDSTERTCGWLESHVPSIATLEWGAEILRDMLEAERSLKRVVDKADTGWFAGRCGNVLIPERAHDGFSCKCGCHHGQACDVDDCDDSPVVPAMICERGLYGSPASRWVRCPECGKTWDAEERRETMRRQAEDELAPVRVIAAVVVGLTDETSVERLTRRIEKWIDREQLDNYGVRVLIPGQKPRRVYRIGDVLRLVNGDSPRRDDVVKPEAC